MAHRVITTRWLHIHKKLQFVINPYIWPLKYTRANKSPNLFLQKWKKQHLDKLKEVNTPLVPLGTANVYKNNLSVQVCPSLSIKAVFSPFKCLYSSKHPKICPYLSRDQIILKYHPLLVQEKSRLVQSFPEKELNFHIMAKPRPDVLSAKHFQLLCSMSTHSTSWSGW